MIQSSESLHDYRGVEFALIPTALYLHALNRSTAKIVLSQSFEPDDSFSTISNNAEAIERISELSFNEIVPDVDFAIKVCFKVQIVVLSVSLHGIAF